MFRCPQCETKKKRLSDLKRHHKRSHGTPLFRGAYENHARSTPTALVAHLVSEGRRCRREAAYAIKRAEKIDERLGEIKKLASKALPGVRYFP